MRPIRLAALSSPIMTNSVIVKQSQSFIKPGSTPPIPADQTSPSGISSFSGPADRWTPLSSRPCLPVLSEDCHQQGPFAPRTLLRFIANTNPSATLSSFDSLPAVHGYRTYLAPEISPWDEEGFSSCSACPCHRAVATTPPKWITVSTSFQSSMLPSPYGSRLGLRGFSLSGPPVRSLSLRPGDSLTSPRDCFVDGLQMFGFPPICHPSYGASDSYPDRTNSC